MNVVHDVCGIYYQNEENIINKKNEDDCISVGACDYYWYSMEFLASQVEFLASQGVHYDVQNNSVMLCVVAAKC